jgi:hypothetical protein
MREDLEWLAANGTRLGGSASERAAAGYIACQLEAAGVAVTLEEFDAFVSHAPDPLRFGPAAVHVVGATPEMLPARVYAFSASTDRPGVEAEAIALGIGSEDEYELADVDVHGKIVVTDLSFALPHSEPARIAAERGAAGLIVVNWSERDGSRTHTSTAKSVWGNPTPDDLDKIGRIPVVALARHDGLRLRQTIANRPTRVRIDARVSREWRRVVQPVAVIPGTSDSFILFHCHLDAFGAGSTDNATGVAGLLELCRVLRPLRDRLGLSLRVAWWACHEMPYAGSTWHLDEHWDEFRRGCVATFNADSWALSGSAGRPVALSFAELADVVHDAIRDVYRLEVPYRDFDFKEAEQTFWSPGISSAFVFSATPDFPNGPITGTWFHTEFDTLDQVDLAALEELVRTYILIGWRVSTAPRLPLAIGALARRVENLIEAVVSAGSSELELTTLAAAAADFTVAADAFEAAPVDEEDRKTTALRVTRILVPVLYTINGPYGQDPVAASYLRPRLPGLRQALDGAERAANDPMRRPAWLTLARRQSNRVHDALSEATTIITRVLERRR